MNSHGRAMGCLFEYFGEKKIPRDIESVEYMAWLIDCSTSPGGPREYHQVSNIRRTLVGNKIVDHSDVVGASPVGAAPTTSSFTT